MKNLRFSAAAVAALVVLAPTGAFAQHTGGGSPVGVKDRADGAAQSDVTGAVDYRLGGSSTMNVNVSRELQHTIQERLARLAEGRHVARTRLSGVEIAPGRIVPREKVRIRRLPAEIVRIAPEYTNYEYFVVEGGAVVIVDPRTYEIVDVLAA